MNKKVYIVAANRSPIGSFLGSLSSLSLVDFSAQTLKQTLAKNQVDPQKIDHLILGNVLSAGNGQGPARQIALKSGLSTYMPAYSLNMVCGSGLKAVFNAWSNIQSGLSDLVAVVGAESMSNAPFLIPGKIRLGHKMGNLTSVDSMINDALTDAFENIHMGVTAENIVKKLNLTREDQDQFAVKSHQKAVAAIKNKAFVNEIVPIQIPSKKGVITFDQDESPREDASVEKLGKLKAIFDANGTVTAGNASSLNDGAAVVVVASQQAVEQNNLTPLVEIIGIGQAGIDPNIMGLGPVDSIKKALDDAKLKLSEIDVLELNEAFAAQSLGVVQLLSEQHKLSKEDILAKTNLNGGAIALGHPVGCSGTRVLVTLIHLLKAQDKTYGLASLCIGGGMGVAIIVKNIRK